MTQDKDLMTLEDLDLCCGCIKSCRLPQHTVRQEAIKWFKLGAPVYEPNWHNFFNITEEDLQDDTKAHKCNAKLRGDIKMSHIFLDIIAILICLINFIINQNHDSMILLAVAIIIAPICIAIDWHDFKSQLCGSEPK